MKTIAIISDMHCGSSWGLTPPSWHRKESHYAYPLQKETWDTYCRVVKRWSNPDVLIVNGDCIEGRQDRQGGAELITNDRNVQVEMAVQAIRRWNADKIFITYGTKYHVGDQAEDFEFNIYQQLRKITHTKIEGHLFFKCEGLVIDARHKLGSSSIPHGRGTALLREMMWNLIQSANDEAPKANIIIRSHVHYHILLEVPNRLMFTTPSLQLSRGRYGSRECSGQTHWGMVRLTLHKGQIIGKDIVICNLLANKPKLIKI